MPETEYHPHDFGEYQAVVFDDSCDEPIGWGRKPPRHYLGAEIWGDDLQSYGARYFVGPGNKWVFVERWLTPDEAREKYGEVTDLELGPRGGFRSVTYGSTKFVNWRLRPDRTKVPQDL